MINLPFQIKFDLDFSEKLPKNELINKIKNLFSNINPAPYINLKTVDINQDLYDFITLVFDEAERQCYDNLWCNLTKEEQIELFCKQFEYQLKTII